MRIKVTHPGLIVQLLPEILIHSSPACLAGSSFPSSRAAAPAIAPVEKAALGGRVHGEGGGHGLAAPRHQLPVDLRGDAIDATVTVLAPLAQNTRDVLRHRNKETGLIIYFLMYTDTNTLHSQNAHTHKPA